jgi:tubulin beta
MVREQITIQVGQCGNQISNQFWDNIIQEHAINNKGVYYGENDYELERINVYFNEGLNNRYIPRTILIDLEPSTLDSIRNGINGELFQPSNFVFGNGGASNNFGIGFYTKGAELVDIVVDNIRKEAEKCDCLQGFQMSHSLGGGTGSGMGTLLISKIREEYPDRIISTFSVIPSPKVSDTVVEPYNATLSLKQLIENADQCFTFDNEALYNICNQKLHIKTPSYGDLNYLISSALCGISSTMRFKGKINSDPRKILTNLVPFQRMHFYTMSYAPINSFKNAIYSTQHQTVSELFNQLFDQRNVMSHADNRQGKYFTCATVFRQKIIYIYIFLLLFLYISIYIYCIHVYIIIYSLIINFLIIYFIHIEVYQVYLVSSNNYIFIYIFIYLYIYIFIYLYIYLFIYIYIYLFIYIF